METALEIWRERANEPWIDGIAPAELRRRVASMHDACGRVAGHLRASRPVRILAEAPEGSPAATVAALLGGLTADVPLRLFLGSSGWSAEQRRSAQTLARPDLIFDSRTGEWNPVEDRPATYSKTGDVVPTASEAGTMVMIASGGTTGGLRFAAHTWPSLAAAARGLQAWWGGGSIDSFCCLPLHHVSGLMQLVRSFVSAGRLALAEWRALEAGEFPRVTRAGAAVSLVPTQLARLQASPAAREWLRRFRAVFLGGAPAWPELLDAARVAGLPLAPCYGLTETAAQVTTLAPRDFLAGGGDAGRSLPHAQIEIVDEAEKPVPVLQSGRIRVRAASLFSGYWPAVGGPRNAFLTGDRGRLAGDGRLTVLGRCDGLINSGGEKIDPAEVEAAVRRTGRVGDVAVIGMPDAEWGEMVVAFVAGLAPGDLEVLARETRARLAPHQAPKLWKVVPALPRNEAGKVNLPALRALAATPRP